MDFIENSSDIEDDCDVINQTPESKHKKLQTGTYEHEKHEFCHTSRNDFNEELYDEEANHSNEVQPFIYVSFNRLQNYYENLPANNNIHIVGKCLRESDIDNYLKDVHEVHNNVKLNFIPQLLNLPENNQYVSVYGHLSIKEDVLTVVVKFWKSVIGDIYEHVNVLEMQTRFVPRSYYDVCEKCDFSALDSSFCDMDDNSIFINNLTYLDNICEK